MTEKTNTFVCQCSVENGKDGGEVQYHVDNINGDLVVTPNCDCPEFPLGPDARFLKNFLASTGPSTIALIDGVRDETTGDFLIQIYSDHPAVTVSEQNFLKRYEPVNLLSGGGYLYEFPADSAEYARIKTCL